MSCNITWDANQLLCAYLSLYVNIHAYLTTTSQQTSSQVALCAIYFLNRNADTVLDFYINIYSHILLFNYFGFICFISRWGIYAPLWFSVSRLVGLQVHLYTYVPTSYSCLMYGIGGWEFAEITLCRCCQRGSAHAPILYIVHYTEFPTHLLLSAVCSNINFV